MPCDSCFGYGLHAIKPNTPIELVDVRYGMPTIECPKCKQSANPQAS